MDKTDTCASNLEPDASPPLADPVYLQELRAQMLKFAVLQLGDKSLAEEAVQEALMGALKNVHAFARRAALKTWVFAILRNKIIDILRRRQRLVEASRLLGDDDSNEAADALFDGRGHWHAEERPGAWSQPAEEARSQQFWRVFEACLNGLPETQSRVFMMREFLELDSDEICQAEQISVSNLHVILHRARLRLRDCLENNWFLEGERG